MSRDIHNSEQNRKKHVTFEMLIADTEDRILEYQERIKKLRKSFVFFKKQASSGIPFPVLEDTRHQEIS